MRSIVILLLIIVGLHVVDFSCTVTYITPETELNPAASYIWQQYGYMGLVVLKCISVGSCIVLTLIIYSAVPRLALITTWVVMLISCVPLVMFGLILMLP